MIREVHIIYLIIISWVCWASQPSRGHRSASEQLRAWAPVQIFLPNARPTMDLRSSEALIRLPPEDFREQHDGR
jgi:hypothetical protein